MSMLTVAECCPSGSGQYIPFISGAEDPYAYGLMGLHAGVVKRTALR